MTDETLAQRHRGVPRVRVVEHWEGMLNRMPTVEAECPRCGHPKAYRWIVEIGSNQSSAQFFRKINKEDHNSGV